jgi:hypothetical protein
MKLILALVALSVATVAQAKTFSFESMVESRLLNPAESVQDFTNRIRAEVRCENLSAKLAEYRESRAALDDDAKQSYAYISQSLDKWDAQLWNLSGHAFTYNGALGQYARKIDEYAANLTTNLTKLQIFLTTFESKLGECRAH